MSNTVTVQPSAIEIAINAAKAAAEAAVVAQAGAIAVQSTASTNVAMPVRPGAKLTMVDMSGGIAVDSWLKVNEHGLTFEGKLIRESVRVSINLPNVAIAYAAKYGNPATYIKTFDRVTEVRGGSWEMALAKANSIVPGTREYRTADVPMTLMQDVVYTDPKSKVSTVVLEKGKVAGNSTSTTNWGNWESFWKDCARQGLTEQTVLVDISAEEKTNKAGNTWGVISFALVAAA